MGRVLRLCPDRPLVFLLQRIDRMDVTVRWMVRQDLADVLEIENLSFPHPWDADIYRENLKSRSCLPLVAELSDGTIIGYVIYTLGDTDITIINMAVHPDYKGNRVASQMINKIKGKLNDHRSHILIAVADYNLECQLFLRHHQFKAIEVAREHFIGGVDAYWFQFKSKVSRPYPERTK